MQGYKIDHQCPQCGAPAVLEETDRLFQCDYCRVRSYLLQKTVFRYVLPNRAPAGSDLLYVPYWRFKGMLFSSAGTKIHHRFIDASHQAADAPLFPVSVGLRSQALNLKFALPDTPGRFMAPSRPLETVMGIFDQRFSNGLPRPIYLQAHIGETLSLLYAPFYVKGSIIDAVVDRPITTGIPEGFDPDAFSAGAPADHIRFVSAICPGCGWDLEGQRDALILTCPNCTSAWKPGRQGLDRIKVAHLPAASEAAVYLPFWRIRADVANISLSTYADLVRLANLPKAVRKEWETLDFCFWSVGFKVRHKDFLRLSRTMTLTPPTARLIREMPGQRLHPVTLPVKEAAESLKILIADFAKPPQKILPLLRKIAITPRSFLLVYVPFVEKPHELVNREFGLTLNKNVLAHAGNL